MIRTESAGGVVVDRRGRVAVVSQKGISWSLPKGHVEAGESKLDAAVREIREETGLTALKYVRPLGSYERYNRGNDRSEVKRISMFLFTTDSDRLEPGDPENPKAEWLPKEDVAARLTYKKDKEFFMSVSGGL